MDIKLENGDFSVSANGDIKTVDGVDEILQRVKICCSIKKGSFLYDKELGVDYENADISSQRGLKQLEMLLNEAVIDISGVRVEITKAENQSDKIKLRLKISYKGNKYETEVII